MPPGVSTWLFVKIGVHSWLIKMNFVVHLCQYEDMMACLLGRAQANLTLPSLRCAIANPFMNFCNPEMRGLGVKCCMVGWAGDFIYKEKETPPYIE